MLLYQRFLLKLPPAVAPPPDCTLIVAGPGAGGDEAVSTDPLAAFTVAHDGRDLPGRAGVLAFGVRQVALACLAHLSLNVCLAADAESATAAAAAAAVTAADAEAVAGVDGREPSAAGVTSPSSISTTLLGSSGSTGGSSTSSGGSGGSGSGSGSSGRHGPPVPVDAGVAFFQRELCHVVHYLYNDTPGDAGPSAALSVLEPRVVQAAAAELLRFLLVVAPLPAVQARLTTHTSLVYCMGLLHVCPPSLAPLLLRLLRPVLLAVNAQTAGVCLRAAAQLLPRVAVGVTKVPAVVAEVVAGAAPDAPTRAADEASVVEFVYAQIMKVRRMWGSGAARCRLLRVSCLSACACVSLPRVAFVRLGSAGSKCCNDACVQPRYAVVWVVPPCAALRRADPVCAVVGRRGAHGCSAGRGARAGGGSGRGLRLRGPPHRGPVCCVVAPSAGTWLGALCTRW